MRRLAPLDLNLLVALDALLRERSVTRAATRLGVSQPALSNMLAKLRDALGDPLFARAGQGVAPTPRALALEAPVREALEKLTGAVAGRAAFRPDESKQTFVIAATDYVQFVLFPLLMARLAQAAPGVSVRVVPVAHEIQWGELETGEVDLVVSGFVTAPADLRSKLVYKDRTVCILRADHPLAGEPMTMARYLSLTHLEVQMMSGPSGVDRVLARRGITRRVALHMPHFLAAPFVVAGGDCCYTVAARIATPMARLLPLRIHPIPFEMPRVMVRARWHPRMDHDAAHTWLRKMITLTAAELPDA